MAWISAARLAADHRLPPTLAGEIVNEATRRALRRHWQPWAWLLPCWLAALASWRHGGNGLGMVALAVLGGLGWLGIARRLATPEIARAVRAKAARLHGDASTGNAVGNDLGKRS